MEIEDIAKIVSSYDKDLARQVIEAWSDSYCILINMIDDLQDENSKLRKRIASLESPTSGAN